MTSETRVSVLVVSVGPRACALPLKHVVETLRPLPVEPLTGAPAFVHGLTVVRGTPVPLVDLRTLLEGPQRDPALAGRWVTVNVGARRVALAVDDVIGIRDVEAAELVELPGLLRHADVDMIATIGVVDAQLLLVLDGARVVPEATWAALHAEALAS